MTGLNMAIGASVTKQKIDPAARVTELEQKGFTLIYQ
jgi:hypothetical protein